MSPAPSGSASGTARSAAPAATVALVTCARLADLTPDDRLLIEPLREEGIGVHAVPWDALGVDWAAFDGAVIRSTWDYHTRPSLFRSWIDRCEAAGVRLWNPPAILRWNLHKAYLHELEERGVPVVPTLRLPRGSAVTLASVLAERGWEQAVVKPAVSAGARRTRLVRRSEPAAGEAALRAVVSRGDALIQPYLTQIEDEGEWSLLFFGREFSHAVLKRPAAGDFRVQERFGGRNEAARPPDGLVEGAAAVLAAVEGDLLYARVDAVREDDRLVLIELEVLEPSLFLEQDAGAARKLAREIARRVLI
jgi:glutathione synthase/RimK-type ligase-like ATP-grasp enzyme